jgi:hypothetical protein
MAPGPPPQAITGADGTYSFERVAPGEYRIMATYFPGVTDPNAAQSVSVSAEQTTNGIEIRMTMQPAYVVSGIVVDQDGNQVEGAMVNPSWSNPGPIGPHSASRTDTSGRFRIGCIPSGTYCLNASRPVTTTSGNGVSFSSMTFSSSSMPQPTTVTVADGNVGGVRLVVVPRP